MNGGLVSGVLWCVYAAEILGLIAVGVFLEKSMHGPNGGGGVGSFLLLFPALALCACAVTFLATNSIAVRAVCLVFMAMPILLVGGDEATTAVQKRWESEQHYERQLGQHLFTTPETKALGSAIYFRNVEQVKQILPTVKNLNQPLDDNKTVLTFAVRHVSSDRPGSLEMVKLLLRAGADPNATPAEALREALLKLDDDVLLPLLEAGADPNAPHYDGSPLWWMAIGENEWHPKRLRTLLDHGANVKLRRGQAGPVGLAVQMRAWDHALLLIERGADWKHEKAASYEIPASKEVLEEYKAAERRLSERQTEIPEALRKLKLMYEGAE